MGRNIRSIPSLPEVTSNPINPVIGQSWVKVNGLVGSAGQAMGVMGITYAKPEAADWAFCVQTAESSIKAVSLT